MNGDSDTNLAANTTPICPYCQSVGPNVGIRVNEGLPQIATIFCQECGKILTCQVVALPQQQARRITIPGGQN